MLATIERLTGTPWKQQGPAVLVGLGHGATHWIIATFYVLLPYISETLGLSYAEAGGLVTLFHAASFTANLGSGAVVDIGGRRVRVLAASLAVGAAALVAVGFAGSVAWLVAPVVLIGLTNNLWHPAAISFLSRRYPDARGFALSIHTLGATVGDMLAPLAAGVLLLALSWQGTASLNALPIFVMAAVLMLTLKETKAAPIGRADGQSSLGAYLQGVGGLVRDRNIIGLCAMAGFRSMTQNGLLVFIPLYLVGVLEASPLVLGVAVMAMQAGGLFAGPIAGAWSDRAGRQPVVLAGLAATTLLVAGLTLVETMVPFIAFVATLGFALFSVRPVIHSWAMDLAAEDMSASAVSVLFGTQSAFTVLVPVAGGLIADVWGLTTVFYILTVSIAVATAITFFLPDPGHRHAQERKTQ